MEQDKFTVLENKAIGRNISMYRKLRGVKASDIAEKLGMKEASYTKYERGETEITVKIVQQVAEFLGIDPLLILSVSPSNFIENCSHFAMHDYHNHQNEQQAQQMMKLLETVVALNEKLLAILDKK